VEVREGFRHQAARVQVGERHYKEGHLSINIIILIHINSISSIMITQMEVREGLWDQAARVQVGERHYKEGHLSDS